MEPITFSPLYMTRVWGGRSLETIYSRTLPDSQPYGESWEISDREGEQSVVDQGIHAGKTLHDLWSGARGEIFGEGLVGERFPLLIKILDARDDLSIQVHPPAEVAKALGGDPKTEMWYIADCDPGASLYVGVKNGVTRESFETALTEGTVAQQIHVITPSPEDFIFIPSGRLHAIGAGFLIYEIQQNSDTTYRVFDWNRMGLDGKPRDLHLKQSLASIDFEDFEPEMDTLDGTTLARCEHFVVDRLDLEESETFATPEDRFTIVTVVSGRVLSEAGRSFNPGDFFLLPRGGARISAVVTSRIILTSLPEN